MGQEPEPITGISNLYKKIMNDPYMPLTIEGIGTGPNGHPAISLCHYFEQNGDLMQDPEMMFECVMTPTVKKVRGEIKTLVQFELFPYAIQQAPVSVYREVYVCDDQGKVTGIRIGVKRELQSFASMWDRNLGAQGFVDAVAK